LQLSAVQSHHNRIHYGSALTGKSEKSRVLPGERGRVGRRFVSYVIIASAANQPILLFARQDNIFEAFLAGLYIAIIYFNFLKKGFLPCLSD